MVILIGIRTKVFLEKEFPRETDPLGGDEGIAIAICQRYMTVFGMPYWGNRKVAKAYSTGTNQPIPVLLWSESMKHNADQMLSSVSGAWKRRILGQVLLLALLGFFLWLFLLGRSNTNTRKFQEQYVSDPKPGDIVLATETTPGGLRPQNEEIRNLFVFRIEEIKGDSLIISRSMQKEDPMKEYQIKNKDKLIGLFDHTSYSPEKEVYSLEKYKQGDERLRRIQVKVANRAEQLIQDSIRRYTDIIVPIYVKRPKK